MSNELIVKLKKLSNQIGNTPMIEIPNFYHSSDKLKVFAKLESYNFLSNIKSRTAFYMIEQGIINGKINEKTTIIESSSGNLAISIGTICHYLGLEFIPIIDPNISPVYEKMLSNLSNKMVKVKERDDTGGYLKNRIKKVKELLNDLPNIYWTNQYENDDNMLAHYHGIGEEIIQYNIKFDYIFVAVSTTGTISGISKKVKEVLPDCQIIGVDVQGSMVFQKEKCKRFISGIGSSLEPKFIKNSLVDDYVVVDEYSGISECQELWLKHGLFTGGSSGCVFSGFKKFLLNNDIKGNVLLIFPDGGYPYIDTIYNSEWVKQNYHCTD